MKITKSDIILSIIEIESSRKRSRKILEDLLEIIKMALERGEDVLISGFGKFCVREKGRRKGRNPATGESLVLDRRRVVTFSCSPVLRNKMN